MSINNTPATELTHANPFAATVAPKFTLSSWRFVQLAPNRRYLHHALQPKRWSHAGPSLADMQNRIDVLNITSVVSNVTATELPDEVQADRSLRTGPNATTAQNGHVNGTLTKMTINGPSRDGDDESALLALYSADSVLASEWLDGLLMLLDQQPITADTNKMIRIIEEWSLKTRMLNLSWEDLDVDDVTGTGRSEGKTQYTREGLDTKYWYDMGEV